jgi:hypothetical protein
VTERSTSLRNVTRLRGDAWNPIVWRKRAVGGYLKKCNTRHNLEGHVGDITHSDLLIRNFLRNFNRSNIFGTDAELHILVAMRLPC